MTVGEREEGRGCYKGTGRGTQWSMSGIPIKTVWPLAPSSVSAQRRLVLQPASGNSHGLIPSVPQHSFSNWSLIYEQLSDWSVLWKCAVKCKCNLSPILSCTFLIKMCSVAPPFRDRKYRESKAEDRSGSLTETPDKKPTSRVLKRASASTFTRLTSLFSTFLTQQVSPVEEGVIWLQ